MILVDLMLMLNSGYVTTLNKIYRNINLALVMALYFLKYLPLCISCFLVITVTIFWPRRNVHTLDKL